MTQEPLVVGAGPTGLSAALFLAERGIKARIIEAATTPSIYSRALAVNPRTLSLLEPTGVTEEMLKAGLPIQKIQMWQGDRKIVEINLAALNHKYPFMLALSQAASERLLTQALERRNIVVERGKSLTNINHTDHGVEATINDHEVAHYPWALGADGAHSAARHQLGIEFEGRTMTQDWFLADVPMDTTLSRETMYAFFLSSGHFILYIPVIDRTNTSVPKNLWRIIGNFDFKIDHHRLFIPVENAIWQSRFHISHRLAKTFAKGHVYLAGDAAHIHSPLGARGMNLGIEDAFVFAELAARNKLDQYSAIRHSVDQRIVTRIERLTNMLARADQPLFRLFRTYAFPSFMRIPFIRQSLMRTATGLDHDIIL